MSRFLLVVMTTLTVLVVCQAQSQEMADLQADIRALRLHVNEVERIALKKKQGCQDGTVGAHTVPSPFPKSFDVRFSPAFESTPAVVTGLILYDNDKNVNDRLVITVSKVNRLGFNVRIHTWSDTRLYGGRIRWMACPKSV